MEDLYTVLGTTAGSDVGVIQSAYRRLAFQYHPDRNPDKREWAEEQMKRINAAYYVLSDADRRRVYDGKRHTGRTSPYYTQPAPRPASSKPPGATATATRRGGAAYPLETENDWFNLHVYAGGRTLPDEEGAVERRMGEYLREYVRLITPPGSGKSALTELLMSAATSQFVVYSPYARLIAKVTLRTTLHMLQKREAGASLSGGGLREMIAAVNDSVQDRMGTESLRMTEGGKNVVADWSGMLLTIIDFVWGEEA